MPCLICLLVILELLFLKEGQQIFDGYELFFGINDIVNLAIDLQEFLIRTI